jgi:GNAT superfamily N-acetyltransferase
MPRRNPPQWDEAYGQIPSYAQNFQRVRVPTSQIASPFMNPTTQERVDELAELEDAGFTLPPIIVNGPFEVEEDDYLEEKYPFLDGHSPEVGEEVWFVHDGHHRVLLALQRRQTHVEALLLESTQPGLSDAQPLSFLPNDPGLQTLSQFLHYRNPGRKFHPESAYKTELESFWMNRSVQPRGQVGYNFGERWTVEGNDNGDLIYFHKDGDDKGRLMAVLHKGTLYVDATVDPRELPDRVFQNREEYVLPIKSIQRVKYPAEYAHLVQNLLEEHRAEFPFLVQNLILGGEQLQIRAKEQPRFDKGDLLVVIRPDGKAVAMASDEWGATLIMVVDEYQGRGIGQALANIWYQLNPSFTSGGFTRAGEANAIRTWAARVREFLANGWYTALIRQGVLSKEQVEAILKELPPSKARKSRRIKEESEPKILVFIDDPKDPVGFVVYDERFLSDPNEKYVYAHGFFRYSENVGMFLFAIDYDRPYAKIATAIALQIAKDEKEPIYVGQGYGDFVEWELVDGAIREGDYVHLTRNVLNISQLARAERSARVPLDRYDEIKNYLLEYSDTKWR